MIDPISALAAVTTAVNLVKKAAKTVDDVRSLGPVLGKYFDAKADAVKVLDEVHKGGLKGSNMGKAVELELALADAKNFEEQVKGLFFPNNMDVWDKIVARRLQMDQQDKIDAKKARDRALRAKQEREELVEICIVVAGVALIFALVGFGAYLVMSGSLR